MNIWVKKIMEIDTSGKDRVKTAINKQKPDRVPLDFSANPPTLQRLIEDLEVSSHRALLERLHVDILDLRGVIEPVYKGPVPFVRELPGAKKQNIWGMITVEKQTATGKEQMYCDFPLANHTLEQLSEHAWPEVDWFDFNGFDQSIRPWSDFALMASGVSLWQHATFLRGMDNLLVDMLTDSETADFILNKFTDFYIEYFERLISATNGHIDILRIADDIGMQDRLLLSPNLFERYLAPRIRRIVEMAHSYDVKVMFHSCGSIRPLIGRLIDLGIDILDPIQVTAKDMNPESLMADYGGKICFHGSIDTQYLLPNSDSNEVASTVRQMIDIFGRGGGFILSPSHILQTDVPTSNIVALYDTAYSYGMSESEKEKN